MILEGGKVRVRDSAFGYYVIRDIVDDTGTNRFVWPTRTTTRARGVRLKKVRR